MEKGRSSKERPKSGTGFFSGTIVLAIGIVLIAGGAGLIIYDVTNLVFPGDGHQWLMWAELLMLFFGFIILWLWAESREEAAAGDRAMRKGQGKEARTGASWSPDEKGMVWGRMDIPARIEALKAAGFSGPLAIRWTAFDYSELPSDVMEAIGIGPGGEEG